MPSWIAIEFTLCEMKDACDDCLATLLKEELAELIHEQCRARKEKGATKITLGLVEAIGGATLETPDGGIINEEMLERLAREFVNHPCTKKHLFEPLMLIIHFHRKP